MVRLLLPFVTRTAKFLKPVPVTTRSISLVNYPGLTSSRQQQWMMFSAVAASHSNSHDHSHSRPTQAEEEEEEDESVPEHEPEPSDSSLVLTALSLVPCVFFTWLWVSDQNVALKAARLVSDQSYIREFIGEYVKFVPTDGLPRVGKYVYLDIEGDVGRGQLIVQVKPREFGHFGRLIVEKIELCPENSTTSYVVYEKS